MLRSNKYFQVFHKTEIDFDSHRLLKDDDKMIMEILDCYNFCIVPFAYLNRIPPAVIWGKRVNLTYIALLFQKRFLLP